MQAVAREWSKVAGHGSLGVGHVAPRTDSVAMMVGGLELTGVERVLEIGTGSGYRAAVLGRLANEVCSVELDPEVAGRARARLERMGSHNVRVANGDASRGWAEAAPYDAILMSVGARELPNELVHQLVLGGRLVIPLGDEGWQLVERVRTRVNGLDTEILGGCRLGMLVTPRKVPSRFPWSRDSIADRKLNLA